MDTLVTSFQHENWANERLLRRLRETPAVDTRAVRLFAHILAAQRMWLARARGEGSDGMDAWPEWSLDECRDVLAQTGPALEALVAAADPAALEQRVTYRNTRGTKYDTRIVDILEHLARHGAYHRGQVIVFLKRGGGEPVNTDYITWVRTSEGQPAR